MYGPDDFLFGVVLPEPGDVASVALLQATRVVDFDADGVVVETAAPLPLTLAGVPGHGVEREELSDRTIPGDNQVRRHLAFSVAQSVDRRLGIGPGRVVDDDRIEVTGAEMTAMVRRLGVVYTLSRESVVSYPQERSVRVVTQDVDALQQLGDLVEQGGEHRSAEHGQILSTFELRAAARGEGHTDLSGQPGHS